MKTREKKVVESEITVGTECDCCKKKILGVSADGWFEFSHHHDEWGNDSVDSYEYFDVCSVHCFTEMLGKSLQEMNDYKRTASIANMDYHFAKELYNKLKAGSELTIKE